MKTPEEIKKGLECCMDYQSCAEYGESKCPYNDVTKCMEVLLADALAYIQQLEARLAQAERERYAAVHDLAIRKSCSTCKNEKNPKTCDRNNPCVGCSNTDCPCSFGTTVNDCWQWRGVCPENTKEDPHAD